LFNFGSAAGAGAAGAGAAVAVAAGAAGAAGAAAVRDMILHKIALLAVILVVFLVGWDSISDVLFVA